MLRPTRLLCFATLPLCAQNYTAKAIHFSPPGTFTQQQLENAAGLRAGSSLSRPERIAQRLVDTGYFDNVGATLDGKINATHRS